MCGYPLPLLPPFLSLSFPPLPLFYPTVRSCSPRTSEEAKCSIQRGTQRPRLCRDQHEGALLDLLLEGALSQAENPLLILLSAIAISSFYFFPLFALILSSSPPLPSRLFSPFLPHTFRSPPSRPSSLSLPLYRFVSTSRTSDSATRCPSPSPT